MRPSQRGHLYFELVEKGHRDEIVGRLDAVIFRTDHLRIRRELRAAGQSLDESVALRCRGQLDFFAAGGRLQLVVRDVDPEFSLGRLERRRREVLAALEAAGLVARNRALPLSETPLHLGLVTSRGSAAYHDFLSLLAASGYGFRLAFHHAAMQGREAEGEVAAALGRLARRDLDAIVLIRGGGARTDLAAFDSQRIAEAIARCPLPVLTGLGHEIDRSLADLVSHCAVATPTKVAELLVARVAAADAAVEGCRDELLRLAGERLRRASERLERCRRIAPAARRSLATAGRREGELARAVAGAARRRLNDAERRRRQLGGRLASLPVRHLERRRQLPERLARRVADLAGGRLRERRATVDGLARLVAELAPERVLRRGFSITRDADGRVLRSAAATRPGDRIATLLADGELSSRVEGP